MRRKMKVFVCCGQEDVSYFIRGGNKGIHCESGYSEILVRKT
jgi:hypothetical protein